MKRISHFLLCLLIGACASVAHASPTYPDKPLKILVGFPAGQATDSVARLVAERLSRALSQPVIVENRPGQGGSLALAQLAKASPDGYQMMLSATASLVTNPHLYKNVGYDTLKDFEPVGLIADLPLVLVATSAAPFNTPQEFLAYAQANPGKLNYSSSGNGTLSHLAMELLQREKGISLTHVPYKGSPRAMVDLAAGNVSVGFDTVAVTKALIDAKRLKLLAVALPERMALLPGTPTMIESGVPDFVASAWLGMVFPKGTPTDIVNKMNAELGKVIAQPDIQKSLQAMGAIPLSSSVAEFAALLKSDYAKWGAIVRESGASVD
ncbi:MAG TPA: tripartite tricarboxylate transporter substrate binding protein [Candidimonas sp.]|nr:tripartite tricarboxylate transporter substrate binding protein [Candidimonas sp.]